MKLNSAASMTPLTWNEFGRMHPFAPPDQANGYRSLIKVLQHSKYIQQTLMHSSTGTVGGPVPDHRLPRGVGAAKLGRDGRVRGPVRHPGVPPLARRQATRNLPRTRQCGESFPVKAALYAADK